MSGAVPPPAARPLGRAARVPRPVCPGCGRCGRGDLAPVPRRAPLRAGVARRGGGGKGVPGGDVVRLCEGRLGSGAPPPPAARPLGGLPGLAGHMLWAPACGRGGMPFGGCVPRGVVGGRPQGGWPATVVRGVWCQALSLPQPPALWGGQPGFCDPCVPAAVGAGVGTQHQPHRVRPCGPALLSVGVAERLPRGGAFHRCEGRLRSGASLPPTARPPGGPLGSATHVLWARVCGCGGPTLSPWPACPVGAACRGVGRGPSQGGWPATVVRGIRCQALSLPQPPVLWGGQPGFRDPRVPGAVGAGVGTQHRSHGARPCGPALLVVGVAVGRPRGGVPFAVVRGVWGQALPLWAGCQGSLGTCCGRGCGCVRSVWCLCGACRGAWCHFSLVPLVLPLSGASVWCGARRVPCACRAPFPARVPCSAAGSKKKSLPCLSWRA